MATIMLGWQLATGGPLGAPALAGVIASPIVMLLPPTLVFLAALVLATLLPPLLRAVTRRTTGAHSRSDCRCCPSRAIPGRPAATVTLLAFSLGAMVFAAAQSATLRQGNEDAAAYRSGLDLRVTELGTALSVAKSVVPVSRYRSLRGRRHRRAGLPRDQHDATGSPGRDPRDRSGRAVGAPRLAR